jgi:hypothetical protein
MLEAAGFPGLADRFRTFVGIRAGAANRWPTRAALVAVVVGEFGAPEVVDGEAGPVCFAAESYAADRHTPSTNAAATANRLALTTLRVCRPGPLPIFEMLEERQAT